MLWLCLCLSVYQCFYIGLAEIKYMYIGVMVCLFVGFFLYFDHTFKGQAGTCPQSTDVGH